MNELTPSMTVGEAGQPPLFFRTADRFRLEGCVAGLVRDGRSLALSSNREAALDHYSRLLISRLRESSPLSPLEVYFPADTAAMLTRFNDVLAAQSVQQAMQLPGLDSPPRIWIVHDAGALADHEVKLLARLVQNFPGANIRIVLLLGTSNQSRKVFDSFDRRMLRWDIEAPTAEQAEAMLLQGREDGCEGAVKTLLKKLDAAAHGAPALADPAGIDPLGFQSPLARPPASTAVFTFSGSADKTRKSAANKTRDARAVKPSRARPAVWRWVLSIVLLASVSVGVTAWLHPTVFSINRAELAQRWATLSNKAAPPKPLPTAVSAAADPVALLAAVTPVTQVPPDEPAAALALLAEPPIAPVAVVAPPVVSIIEPAAEALENQSWVNAMPTDAFVVQYAAMPTFQAAVDWKKGVPALSDARTVAAYRPRENLAYFVVVAGPFPSRALATQAGNARGKPGGAWVRTARSLREQFNPVPVAAGTLQESRQ